MTAIQAARSAFVRLTPEEKIQLFRWIARDLQPGFAQTGIEKTPGVNGGAACVVRTRIPVWSLVEYRRLGLSDADILYNYPTLRAEDLVAAWNYYEANSAEIEQNLRGQAAA